MDVVILLVFISLTLVAAGLYFFFHRLRAGDFEHGERLALTPLSDDEPGDEESPNGGPEDAPRDAKEPEGGRPYVES